MVESFNKVSDMWLQMIYDGVPKAQPGTLGELIRINQGGMEERITSYQHSINLLNLDSIQKFMSKSKYWTRQTMDINRRIEILRQMLDLRRRQHIEMLQITQFRDYVDVRKLICVFSKTHFINLTVQENSYNSLLTLQGYFLKNFIYFHMRHDMRFKASIDSFMIEMDNPATRQQIRNENRRDPVLQEKYLKEGSFNVQKFCEYLLSNFFPNIAGIWADHSQMAPAYILQFIRLCLEYGFIEVSFARKLLDLILKATLSLMKLEESWTERQLEKKAMFSERMKVYNATGLFAKCREHIAMILIQILVLLSDSFLIDSLNKWTIENTPEEEIVEETKENLPFLDKEINDSVLTITMNYLSMTTEILEYKSTNDFCRAAVEMIFMYVTTKTNDCFLNSIKSIGKRDLEYFKTSDAELVPQEARGEAAKISSTLLCLLEVTSQGVFEPVDGGIDLSSNSKYSTSKNFEQYLRKYITAGEKQSTIGNMFKKIAAEISDWINIHPNFKMALVVESVPLKLVSFAHYCSTYFESGSYGSIAKDCFKLLGQLCFKSNACKAQLFKGEGLFHYKKLLENFDMEAFILLFEVCKESNAAIFLGRDIFEIFLTLYEKFNSEICKHLDLENPAQNLNIVNCTTLLLMIKYMYRLFSKKFLDETEKLQNMLLTQETAFKNLAEKLLPLILARYKNLASPSSPQPETSLNNTLFEDGNEFKLMGYIKKNDLSSNEVDILVMHLAFWTLKLYNMLCADCYSQKQYEVILPCCDKLMKKILFSTNMPQNSWMLPIGLDAELFILIKNFRILPQQNILIENTMDTIQSVVGSSYCDRRVEINLRLKKLNKEITTLYSTIKEVGKSAEAEELTKTLHQKEKEIKDLKTEIENFKDEELKLFKSIFNRVEWYSQQEERKEESLKLVYEGLLPLLHKYLAAILNNNILESSRAHKLFYSHIQSLAVAFKHLAPALNKITGKNLTVDLEKMGYKVIIELSIHKEEPKLVSADVSPELPAAIPNMPTEEYEKISLMACSSLIEIIGDYYNEVSDFENPLVVMKDMSKEEFEESLFSGKLEEKKTNAGDKFDMVKQSKIKIYIKAYEQAKEHYLQADTEPNLIGFFDRNNQNLRGVFNSCLDRLLNRKKAERIKKKEYLAENYPVSKFWVQSSGKAFVSMITLLVSKSESARKELYDYFTEHIEEEEESEDEGTVIDKRLSYLEKRKDQEEEDFKHGTIRREDLLAILIRIHVDLVFYLNASSSRHAIWWVTHQTYEMISMFFKNLCECNFLKFKVYLAENTPYLKGELWEQICSTKSYSEIVALEMKSVMKTTRIGANREPHLLRSDFHDRVHEILLPLLEIANEATVGPCKENQTIFLKADLSSLCSLAMRTIDDMGSSFFELSNMTLSLISALVEGATKTNEVLEAVSGKISSSIIADRMLRMMKKLYITQLMINDEYESKAKGSVDKRFVTSFKASLKAKKTKSFDQENNDGSDAQNETIQKLIPSSPEMNSSPNKIVPISMKDVKEVRLLTELVGERAQMIISEDIEKTIEIESWKDLMRVYNDHEEFYNSPVFGYCFKLLLIWETLAISSKTHQNRLEEVKLESKHFFGKKSNISFFDTSKEETNKSTELIAKKPTEFCCVYFFLRKKVMCSVEIIDHEERYVILSFPRLPQTFKLSSEATSNYRSECDIVDSNTKMLDLLRNFDLFSIQMDNSFWMSQKLGLLYNFISTDAFYYYTLFCWWIGFGLNLTLLLALAYVNNSDDYVQRSDEYGFAILFLRSAMIAMSGLFLILWFAFKYYPTYKIAVEDYKFENPGKPVTGFKSFFKIVVQKCLIGQAFPMSYTMHLVFTILGWFVSPIFYTFNLLLIINISKTTKFVMKAILLHIDQLGITFMLAIFVIFCYTILAMSTLFEQINVEPGNNVCSELYSCFFFVLNYGLRNGGGFAESLTAIDTGKKFAGRTIFDISFFMLITVISLNIIFGIIIDTFSQLRDEHYERTHDLENICFVCGLHRVEFSKKNINFDDHKDADHDPWKYIYFIYYLKQKGEEELSGLEYHAWSGFKQKETFWIPIGKTCYLGEQDEEQLNLLENKITKHEDELKNMLNAVTKTFKRMKRLQDHYQKGSSSPSKHPTGTPRYSK